MTMLSFCIVDDDAVSRRMLESIIEDSDLGDVIGTASGGIEGVNLTLLMNPDVVLIDLLMPDQDGIETITQLKKNGFIGKFIMISQIENKEMVGEAYQIGIDFFIHKPINRIEVEAVLNKLKVQMTLNRSIIEIKQSLASLEQIQPVSTSISLERSVREDVQAVLMDLGIIGEIGSKDMIHGMEYLFENLYSVNFPPLKELYEAIARKNKQWEDEVSREVKAIEQRIRRTVITALNHLASLGLTDYSNPKFEHYAPLFFDFQDVRLKMNEINDGIDSSKVKVNIKKFLHVLYLETMEKRRTR